MSDLKISVKVHINGMQTTIMQSHGHFDDMNVLGTDFMTIFNGVLTANFKRSTVKLVLNSQ